MAVQQRQRSRLCRSPVFLEGGGPIDAPDPITTFHVNSVTGDDNNDGSTPDLAFATLGALPTLQAGDTIKLARGSQWREIVSPGVDDLTFEAYGTGDAPLIDASDVITPSDFTLSAHGDAAGVCYEYAWTRGAGAEGGIDYVLLWEGDTRLVRRTSVALCAANAGSYYANPDDGAVATIYVHPFGSTNPVSDGKTYSVTKRGSGLYARFNNGYTVTGIRTRRGWAHYGPLVPGETSIVRKAIFEGGGLHHAVSGGDLIEDSIALDMPENFGQVVAPVTFYRADGTASDATARRVFITGAAPASTAHSGILAHTSGAPGWRTLTYDQCIIQNGGGMSGDASTLVISNSAVLRGSSLVTMNTRSALTIERLLVKDGTGGVGVSGPDTTVPMTFVVRDCALTVNDIDSLNIALSCIYRVGTVLIENCVIYWAGDKGARALQFRGVDASNRLAVTVRNCIIAGATTRNIQNIDLDLYADYVGENNIFYRPTFNAAFRYQGDYLESIASWQSLTGTDADSVDADPQFSGDPTAGDFRLVPGGLADVMGCGPQTHWDYNTRTIEAGPPVAWPTPPATLAEAEAYIADPEAWDFYP
jgi:hypothetical protein